jgi:hypothetical protein
MNESLVKYLAGLLDADGSLSFECHRGYDDRVRISLKLHLVAVESMDRHGFIASLPTLTGFGSINQYALGNAQVVQWFVGHRADLEMLLPRLIKHMVIKARHWQWLLDYWRDYRSQAKGQKSLSEAEWQALSAASRESRKNVGPIKPKNHPTWAWLAGYLDGDGCFSFRTSRNHNMRLSVSAHVTDLSVLEFLQNSFGGTIKPNSAKPQIKVWWRGLGPSHASFVLRFLPQLVKHSRFKKHKIEQMIHFHRQRLSVSRATGPSDSLNSQAAI